MTIQLTKDQQTAIRSCHEGPVCVIDPTTNESYVLLKQAEYAQFKALLAGDVDVKEAYPLIDAVAAREGWNDPTLDVYNDLANAPQQ